MLGGWLLMSCSTTKCLEPGQQRLVSNKVHVLNDRKFNADNLQQYLKQKALPWSPMLCVYNWENGRDGGWDKFVHKIGTAPVIFDSLLISSSISNIDNHLQYLGYYGSTISHSVRYKGRKKVAVSYDVTLGKRFPIRSIGYNLDIPQGEFTDDFAADTLKRNIHRGDYLSESSLEDESNRTAGNMRNIGYYDFNKNFFFFEADTITAPDSANLKIIIRGKGQTFEKYSFGGIKVNYPENLRIREKVLTDLCNIRSGEPYSARNVDILYNRFSSISLFNAVNVELMPRDSVPVVDCIIHLSKSKLSGFKIGLQASINSNYLFGISPELNFFHKNLFHGGEVLNVSITSTNQLKFNESSVKSNEVGVSASLTVPRFLPFKTSRFKGSSIPKTEIKLSYNFQNRPEFARNMFSGSFGYVGSLRKRFYYQVKPVSINYVHMPRIADEFLKSLETNPFLKNAYENHLDAGLKATLGFATSSVLNPTESFWYSQLQFDVSGNVLALFGGFMAKNTEGHNLILNVPYSQYVRANLDLGRTFIWGKNNGFAMAFHLRSGIGHAYGNSKSLPFEQHFYCGGANSLRGWTARTIGPGSTPLNTKWVIPNQTGDLLLEANAEFRFKIFWKLAGALFVDAGNVWKIGPDADEQSRFSLSSIAADCGYGLRVDLSFIVLRIDVGMRMRDPSLEQPWIKASQWMKSGNYAVHFGVGYPF